MIMAVASSHLDKAIDPQTVVLGEVGLAGEVRAVTQPELRIAEAEKLGFNTCIIPTGSIKRLKKGAIKVEGVASVQDAMQLLFDR
jgi:DNA repair protein RadA/Sms